MQDISRRASEGVTDITEGSGVEGENTSEQRMALQVECRRYDVCHGSVTQRERLRGVRRHTWMYVPAGTVASNSPIEGLVFTSRRPRRHFNVRQCLSKVKYHRSFA